MEKDLFLRTMGISNLCYDTEHKKMYSIQFYDYDKNGAEKINKAHLNAILSIFPYDCLWYETKHGFHFISFALLHGKNITKARALQTTKFLEGQDYWCSLKDLTLRVSPKWKVHKLSKWYEIVSPKPKFKGVIKGPNGFIISMNHLEFYHNFMKLPEWIYEKYLMCQLRDYRIKVVTYKTRD